MNINKRFREEDANNDSTRLQPVTKKLIPFPKSSNAVTEVPPVAQEPAIPYGTFFTSRIINNFNQNQNRVIELVDLESPVEEKNLFNSGNKFVNIIDSTHKKISQRKSINNVFFLIKLERSNQKLFFIKYRRLYSQKLHKF